MGRERLARAGVQAFLHQVAQPLLGLLLLVTPNQFTHVLAGVAVLAGAHALVDIAAHGFGQSKAHRVGAHGLDVLLDYQ